MGAELGQAQPSWSKAWCWSKSAIIGLRIDPKAFLAVMLSDAKFKLVWIGGWVAGWVVVTIENIAISASSLDLGLG